MMVIALISVTGRVIIAGSYIFLLLRPFLNPLGLQQAPQLVTVLYLVK